MNIVEQAARIIDPGAFAEWITTHEISELMKAEVAYRRSKALCIASKVLKLACKQPNLKQQLVECELEGWRKAGLPVERPEVRQMVEQKY